MTPQNTSLALTYYAMAKYLFGCLYFLISKTIFFQSVCIIFLQSAISSAWYIFFKKVPAEAIFIHSAGWFRDIFSWRNNFRKWQLDLGGKAFLYNYGAIIQNPSAVLSKFYLSSYLPPTADVLREIQTGWRSTDAGLTRDFKDACAQRCCAPLRPSTGAFCCLIGTCTCIASTQR